MPGQRWNKEEIESLIRQIVSEGKPLADIYIPGKSQAAVNNQRRRLKEAELLNGSFAGRKLRPWTICELKKLTELTHEYGFSAGLIGQLQLIPGRSTEAVSKMMGRHGLGNADVKLRAKGAVRLDKIRREALKSFLLGEGRLVPSGEIATQWGLAQKTVNGYRQRLGITISWAQARSSEKFKSRQQEQASEFSRRTRDRWRIWRESLERRLERRSAEIQRQPAPPPSRVCAMCSKQWFATAEFYSGQSRKVGARIKKSISRTCRLCRSAQRHPDQVVSAGGISSQCWPVSIETPALVESILAEPWSLPLTQSLATFEQAAQLHP
jgi:hypothetical protein